jgi:hypothetical protein
MYKIPVLHIKYVEHLNAEQPLFKVPLWELPGLWEKLFLINCPIRLLAHPASLHLCFPVLLALPSKKIPFCLTFQAVVYLKVKAVS